MRRSNLESDSVCSTSRSAATRSSNTNNGQLQQPVVYNKYGFANGSRFLFSQKIKSTTLPLLFHFDGNQQLQLQPRIISTFFKIGGLFLVGVHLYLYHCSIVMVQPRDEIAFPNGPASSSVNDHHQQQPRKQLTPLRAIDREFYTIRINTWKRPELLQVSIDHHASCPGVKQIQVVWCDPDQDPPASLLQHPKVVAERHAVNSLNERFHIITSDTPTLGILSIDDDVLRPCEAIDNGFMVWSQNPERMVGFDARVHVVNPTDGSWKYGYQSTTEKVNEYSLSLPRYCFLHRDYLHWYMTDLPRPIFSTVASTFNCEDVAMSLFISSLTDGRPPLLADMWAIMSMTKLYSEKRISAQKNHKSLRDECVNSFAEQLHVKAGSKQLQTATFLHKELPLFECGGSRSTLETPVVARLADLAQKVQQWKSKRLEATVKELSKVKAAISRQAYDLGLIENSDPWKKRWKSNVG